MPLHLGQEIGSGAVGRVVEVSEGDGTSVYAGKILHASHSTDSSAGVRFANEAALLAEVEHPNLVRVFGIQEVEGHEVLLMERIVGDSLATVIARSAPMPEPRIVELAQGLAAGLAAAHHAGLVHRDLKPANVLIAEDETPKIVDFGMARASSFAGIGREALAVVGTPAYMAPETTDPLAVDARSDLYALGCILFEMATGSLPYGGATSFAVLESHRHDPIPELPASIGASLRQLIERLLAKSPADRPQSAGAVHDELSSMRNKGTAALVIKSVQHGQCAACGDALVPDVDVCFGCGAALPSLGPGRAAVFVTGPGDVASKLDIGLRQTLLDWLRANPSLGLDASALAKSVPRLPFPLVLGVADVSAERLARAVESLGLECAIERGGRFSLPAMRKKSWKLSGRTALIFATSFAYMANTLKLYIVPFVAVAAVGSVVLGWHRAGKRLVKQGPTRRALPPAVSESLDRVSGVLPAMDARRHRENLRAIVSRALSLHEFFAERKLTDFDEEVARVIDMAVVAAARIDELEAAIERDGLLSDSEASRAELRERDMWAARLMDTTATLESLRARYVAGELAIEDRSRDELLEELRSRVAALREVQSL